ncbi:MAG: hypothetical protein M1837_006288 [Sclerophora amabilis]|nr:MAG: hypothetical protein M1837_006288 [Sclerophora amabilis]
MSTSKFTELLSPDIQQSSPGSDVRLEDILAQTSRASSSKTASYRRAQPSGPSSHSPNRTWLPKLSLKGIRAGPYESLAVALPRRSVSSRPRSQNLDEVKSIEALEGVKPECYGQHSRKESVCANVRLQYLTLIDTGILRLSEWTSLGLSNDHDHILFIALEGCFCACRFYNSIKEAIKTV